GLAPTPWALGGSGGTGAGMPDRGVPPVVTDPSYSLRPGLTPEPPRHHLVYRFDESFAAKLAQGAIRRGSPHADERAYSTFIESLEGTPPTGVSADEIAGDTLGASKL